MNISNSEREFLSLASRLEQMEWQQAMLRQYLQRMKRELDNLVDKFENRPDVQIVESLQWEIADLQNFIYQNFNQNQDNTRTYISDKSEFLLNTTAIFLESIDSLML